MTIKDESKAENETIAAQNDRFRQVAVGKARPGDTSGRVVVTQSISSHGEAFALAALMAVAQDATFTEDNDPWGDRGFGTVIVEGQKVWWKIDLYDANYEWGSPNPTDLAATRRVLTIMFPEDY